MTTDKPGDWETVFEESFHHHNRLLAIILSSARLFTILSTFHHHSCSFKSKLGVIKSNVIIIIDKSHRNLWFWLVNCWYDDPTTDCKWKLRFCICRFNLASESCGNKTTEACHRKWNYLYDPIKRLHPPIHPVFQYLPKSKCWANTPWICKSILQPLVSCFSLPKEFLR